ncbi:MAG TPA: hypothetical protein GX010_03920 [Erysipelotrichaceae bacterium]|nr:hypothetical protein [Erysipelotrichaceae bacterium]
MAKLPLIILAFILPSVYSVNKIGSPIIIVDPNNPSGSLSFPPISFSSSSASSSSKQPSSSISSSSSNNTYSDYISTAGIYGPYHVGDEDFSVSFNYRLNISNQSIKERLRLLDGNNEVVHAETKAIKEYANNSLNNVSFNVPISSFFTEKGLTIKFEILKSSGNYILKGHEAKFYPPKHQYVNYQTLKQNPYVSQNLGFYADGTSLKGIYETIDFREIGDYLDVDYYYRLSLKNVKFRYESLFPLEYKNINLRFNDKENLFPYVNHDLHNDINLPLVLENKQGAVSFAFKDKFYVNKRTLQISETYQVGYALTSDFYLPINGKKIFNDKNLFIDIEDLGADKMSTTIAVKYDVSKSLMGLCHDAEHCLVGGTK